MVVETGSGQEAVVVLTKEQQRDLLNYHLISS